MWVRGLGSVPGIPGALWQLNQHWFGWLYRCRRQGSKGESVSCTSTHLMEAPLSGSRLRQPIGIPQDVFQNTDVQPSTRTSRSESLGARPRESACLTSSVATPRAGGWGAPTDAMGHSRPSHRLSWGTHRCRWPAAWWSAGSARGSAGSRHSRSASWLWRWSLASCQPCCPAQAIHPLERERRSPETTNVLGKIPPPAAFTLQAARPMTGAVCPHTPGSQGPGGQHRDR